MTTRNSASLKRRFAALIYESLFIVAVAIVAGIFAGLLNTFLVRVMPSVAMVMPVLTTFIFLFFWWFYFKINWVREGQTLPMRVWGIGMTDLSGARPALARLKMRFMWAAVFLLFVPMCAYAALRYVGASPKMSMGLAALWWMLPWGFALFHPRKQFLYDYLAGTELVDVRKK
ncbi:RDD family protein [Neisseriaceae bacterium B1]